MSSMKLETLLFKSASVFLVLIISMHAIAQVKFDVVIKTKTLLKNDEFGDCNAKIVVSDNKVVVIDKKKSPKGNSSNYFEMEYPAYNLETGIKHKIKVRIKEPLFEYVDVDNSNTQVCDNLILLRINEFERFNLDYVKTRLLILKKSTQNTYTEIGSIDNFQRYDGACYQVSSTKIVFYKNYDYHPLDDSIPTLTSVYNVESGKFEKLQPEYFKGLYITNLVGQLVAVKKGCIIRAYPAENLVTVANESLQLVDTIYIKMDKDYSDLFNTIDSLKKVCTSKKEFIHLSKKVDKHIERIESIYLLSYSKLGIVIKPESVDNFSRRKLLIYDFVLKSITDTFYLNYEYTGLKNVITEPNFTYTNNAILFIEKLNAVLYTTTIRHVKNGKIKGDENYFIHLMKYNSENGFSIQHTKSNLNLLNEANLSLFSLKGDTIRLSQLLSKNGVFLIKNHKNCSPCFKKAYQLINKEYRKFDKYYLCEYSGEYLNLLIDEKNIKKSINVKNIYYFKSDLGGNNELFNLIDTPSPFMIITSSGKIEYISLSKINDE